MSLQHPQLAAGGWAQLTLAEQMANIGSEVERALNWRAKNNEDYSQRAYERALELIDLTLDTAKSPGLLREAARVREAVVDFFSGTNEFDSSDAAWKKYFSAFTYAARKNT